MKKIEELRKEIKEREELLQKLEEEEKYLVSKGPQYKLAVALHESLCHTNHADGCGWYYEMKDERHDWNGWAHERYLKIAKKMLNTTGLDVDTILKVVECL